MQKRLAFDGWRPRLTLVALVGRMLTSLCNGSAKEIGISPVPALVEWAK
jgi:hypothetical protein